MMFNAEGTPRRDLPGRVLKFPELAASIHTVDTYLVGI
jgi:hypothetical protein